MKRKEKISKTATILQMEAAECGAASLGMVLAYHEKYIALDELREKCGVSRDGSKAKNILRAARKYGMTAKGYKREPEKLKNMNFPVIIHWNFNHFLILEGFKNGKAYLNDPALGKRVISEKEFDYSYTGIVLEFVKTDKFEKSGKPLIMTNMIVSRIKGNELTIIYIFLLSLIMVLPGILIPGLTKIFIDEILLNGLDSWLILLVSGMLITALFRSILSFFQEKYLVKIENKISVVSSYKFFEHVLKLPIDFFWQRYSGEIGNGIHLNDRLGILLGEMILAGVNVIIVIFYLIFMGFYSVSLSFLVILLAMINIAFLKYISKYRENLNQRSINDKAKLEGVSTSGLQMIETIKATGNEEEFFRKWSGLHVKLVNNEHKLEFTSEVLNLVPEFVEQLTNISVLFFGGYLIIKGKMSIGMLVAFQSLLISFMSSIRSLVDFGSSLQEIKGAITRLDDILNNNEIAEKISEDLKEETQFKLEGYIELKNVTFGYSKLDEPLIKDFNIRIRPGERVAIVGGSGSGKSTIAKLISGLYEPWSGEIYFDGRNKKNIKRFLLANSLSMVDQSVSIFEGKIKDNIALWDKTISEDKVKLAARNACIDQDINELVNGYETYVLEDGRNFSGGQRQRIEIARAFATEPSILVLDEATSALDTILEKEINNNIKQSGTTTIVIAHRLSTIRDCDVIIVLDNGKVVQSGNHYELIKEDGFYKKLVMSY